MASEKFHQLETGASIEHQENKELERSRLLFEGSVRAIKDLTLLRKYAVQTPEATWNTSHGLEVLRKAAKLEFDLGLSPEASLLTFRKIAENQYDPKNKSSAFAKLAQLKSELGKNKADVEVDINEALRAYKEQNGGSPMAIQEITKAQLAAGIDAEECLKEAQDSAKLQTNPKESTKVFSALAILEAQAGKNPWKSFYRARVAEQDVRRDDTGAQDATQAIKVAKESLGNIFPDERIEAAREYIEKVVHHPYFSEAETHTSFYRAEACLELAKLEAKAGRNPQSTLETARQYANQESEWMKTVAMLEIAETEVSLGKSYSQSLNSARATATNVESTSTRAKLFTRIAEFEVAQKIDAAGSIREIEHGKDPDQSLVELDLGQGLIEQAESHAAQLSYSDAKLNAYLIIADRKREQGLDPASAFDRARNAASQVKDENRREYLMGDLVRAEAKIGLADAALRDARSITNPGRRAFALLEVAEILIAKNEDSRSLIEAAKREAGEIGWDTGQFLVKLLEVEFKASMDTTKTREDARRAINRLGGRNGMQSILEFAKKEKSFGLNPKVTLEEARKNLVKNDLGMQADEIASELFDIIEIEIPKEFMKKFSSLPLDQAMSVTGRSAVPEAAFLLGYVHPEARVGRSSEKSMSDAQRVALNAGASFRTIERQPDESLEFLREAARQASSPGTLRELARNLDELPYSAVSDILIKKVDQWEDPLVKVRLLKTLIEVNNPKGKLIATRLYADPKLPVRLKDYLETKLIDSGSWDIELKQVLQTELDGGSSKEEIRNVLETIIREFDLPPEVLTYKVLAKQGFLKGETMSERVQELKELARDWDSLSRVELLGKLAAPDSTEVELYYLLNGGKWSYPAIDNYRFAKFKHVVEKINGEKLDENKLQQFSDAMAKSGVGDADRQRIIEDFRLGRFPIPEHERTVTFSARVEYGSEREAALKRLQNIWNVELASILLSAERSQVPENIAESSKVLEGWDGVFSGRITKHIAGLLRIGEKIDETALRKIFEDIRKEYASLAKNQGKSITIETPNIEILIEYMRERLPALKGTGAMNEWRSHMREVMTVLEKSESKREIKKEKNIDFELTFLDKEKDFIRAIRFADAAQCCFNSDSYQTGERERDDWGYDEDEGDVEHEAPQSAGDWVARLNADPLSFVIDLKEKNARTIEGFIFGRLGKDGEGRPIVMLNGIYSQTKGDTLTNNILKAVEEKFANKIGASMIVIANKHGGELSRIPAGYEAVKNLELTAIRALEKRVSTYDDIGNVANGKFQFSGLIKNLK